MTFTEKPTAIIWAKDGDTGEFVSIGGVTPGASTVENAKAQIDKILGIVGKSVLVDGMTRIRTEEATNNG